MSTAIVTRSRLRQPWDTEPDYWSEHVGDVHLIAVRMPRSQAWSGYIGLPKETWLDINVEAVPMHFNEATFFGTRDRFGGLPGYCYLGFDCCRADASQSPDGHRDFSPQDFLANRTSAMLNGKYRTLEYVQGVCRAAAANLHQQRSWWSRLRRAFARWVRGQS